MNTTNLSIKITRVQIYNSAGGYNPDHAETVTITDYDPSTDEITFIDEQGITCHHTLDNYNLHNDDLDPTEPSNWSSFISSQPREITPHKGGRSRRAPDARLTPDERVRLDAILDMNNESMADWISRHITLDTLSATELAGFWYSTDEKIAGEPQFTTDLRSQYVEYSASFSNAATNEYPLDNYSQFVERWQWITEDDLKGNSDLRDEIVGNMDHIYDDDIVEYLKKIGVL